MLIQNMYHVWGIDLKEAASKHTTLNFIISIEIYYFYNRRQGGYVFTGVR